MSTLITRELIDSSKAELSSNKLKATQREDLFSFFRIYLSEIASRYSIEQTLADLTDTSDKETCAKLVACLTLVQENEFYAQGGFAPTNANRTGYNDDYERENFLIFKYAWTLLWDLPKEIEAKFIQNSSRTGTKQIVAFRKM